MREQIRKIIHLYNNLLLDFRIVNCDVQSFAEKRQGFTRFQYSHVGLGPDPMTLSLGRVSATSAEQL